MFIKIIQDCKGFINFSMNWSLFLGVLLNHKRIWYILGIWRLGQIKFSKRYGSLDFVSNFHTFFQIKFSKRYGSYLQNLTIDTIVTTDDNADFYDKLLIMTFWKNLVQLKNLYWPIYSDEGGDQYSITAYYVTKDGIFYVRM